MAMQAETYSISAAHGYFRQLERQHWTDLEQLPIQVSLVIHWTLGIVGTNISSSMLSLHSNDFSPIQGPTSTAVLSQPTCTGQSFWRQVSKALQDSICSLEVHALPRLCRLDHLSIWRCSAFKASPASHLSWVTVMLSMPLGLQTQRC